MAQIFEVTWSEGVVTPELISSLLRQYVTQGGLYGTIVVKEAAQQTVALDGGGRCAVCGREQINFFGCPELSCESHRN
jgi:hypothetical protein